MKRLFIPFLMVICMLGLTACGNAESESDTASSETTIQTEAQQTEAEGQTDNNDDKSVPADTVSPETKDNTQSSGKDTIVVYFSATGTTKGVAERIENVSNADLYEI